MLSQLVFVLQARADAPIGFPRAAGTEYFVLDRKKQANHFWQFFVVPVDPATGATGEAGAWIKFDAQNPRALLFGSDEDRLAHPTARPERAVYLKTAVELPIAKIDSTHLASLRSRPDWNAKLFGSLDRNMPLTGARAVDAATDTGNACPAQPQQKTGRPCEIDRAFDLPPRLVSLIKAAALKHGILPEVLAALLHTESKFDFWLENKAARAACGADHKSDRCSRYGWERGVGQIGTELSKRYGLNWHVAISRPSSCGRSPWTDVCIDDLERSCSEIPRVQLKPYNCPSAAIDAAARRLSEGVKSTVDFRVRDASAGLRIVSVSRALARDRGSAEYSRNLVSAYNRGPRVANSYFEFFRQNGRFPSSYGEAWATRRTESTPGKAVGFQLLQGEFINRCYVHSIVGLCGEFPDESLARKYQLKFRAIAVDSVALAQEPPSNKTNQKLSVH